MILDTGLATHLPDEDRLPCNKYAKYFASTGTLAPERVQKRSADARGVSRRRKRQKSRSLGIAPVVYCLTWGFKNEPVITILFIDGFYRLENLNFSKR